MTQSQALDILKTGNAVFLTGEPGSGKTYTINQYVAYLRSHEISVAITASTGIAATHVGGMTIHSWSGIGIQKMLSKEDLRDLAKNSRIVNRLLKTSVLIIDEISMLDGQTFDLIELVCRTIRKKDEPFGGLQVVCVGDFFQLPPVSRKGDPAGTFAFQSRAWNMLDPRICYLTEHHRQEDDVFLGILRSIRSGYLADEEKEQLLARSIVEDIDLVDVEVPKLFPHNANVDQLNEFELRRIPGKKYTFEMESYGAPPLVEQLKKGCLSPESLQLKKGARVMFTKNSFTERYVNGTLGTVIGFADESGFPVVETKSGDQIEVTPTTWSIRAEDKELASIVQIPLRLAWAMTVHKSQGMSLDAAFVDLSHAFVSGQGYVALSRVRSMSGLYLGGLNAKSLEVNQDVLMKDAEFRRASFESEEVLGLLSQEDLHQRHERFIRECDGVLETVHCDVIESKMDRKQKKKKEPKISTKEQTLALLRIGMQPQQIAQVRGLKMGTIITHLENVLEEKLCSTQDMMHIRIAEEKLFDRIAQIFDQHQTHHLQPVFDELDGKVSFETIRLARLFWQKN